MKDAEIKKNLAEIWKELSACRYGDEMKTMAIVSKAKAKCLTLIDPALLWMNDDEIARNLSGLKNEKPSY